LADRAVDFHSSWPLSARTATRPPRGPVMIIGTRWCVIAMQELYSGPAEKPWLAHSGAPVCLFSATMQLWPPGLIDSKWSTRESSDLPM
jgi:hypothetical protein